MIIEEIEKQKMDIMKELATTNLKISEAKNLLYELQKDETKYIEEREKRTLEKINKVFLESKDIIDKVYENYKETHEFCQSVTEYSNFLSESHEKFSNLLTAFNERNKKWDIEIERKEKEFEGIKKQITLESNFIKNEKKNLINLQKKLKEEEKIINDKRGVVERMIIRLKEGRI